MKVINKISMTLLLIVLVIVGLCDPAQVFADDNEYSNQGATYKVTEVVDEYDLGFGVKYHREISGTKKAGSTGFDPQQVNVLQITPSDEVSLVPYAFLEGNQWYATTVKKAALQYEATNPGYRVIAAVNGDYFKINEVVKASTGVTIGQGEYYKTTSDHGGVNSIAIRNNGSGKQLFTTRVTEQSPFLAIYDKDNNIIKEIKIDKVNKEPGDNEISLYYAQRETNFGRNFITEKVSDAWFVKQGLYAVTSRKDSFYGIGNISSFVTAETVVDRSQFAIKCNNKEINDMLNVDVKVRVQYEFTDPSLEGIDNYIGFPFTIIEDGKIINADTNRHPRTIIGQKENGEIVLAVIDGRQTNKNMYGVCSYEMAAIMGYYGCVDAWNLDGGGSSTLIIRKQNDWVFNNENNGFNNDNSDWYVTNNPSDGSERSDGNHLLVVVKLPQVTIDIESAEVDSITLKVALLSEIEKYKDLYILMGKEYYQIVDGKVTVPGLKKNVSYDFYLYSKVGDNYINLMTSKTYTTSKAKPTDIDVTVSLLERGDSVQILFRYKVDKSEAVKKIVYIGNNGERYLSASQTITFEKTEEIYQMIKDGVIEITYLANPSFPEESITLDKFDIEFDTLFMIDEMLFMTTNDIKNIFE